MPFQESIGGVVFETPDLACCVVKGKALLCAEGSDGRLVEALISRDAEMIFVGEMDQSHDAPEIINPIRIIERHAPAVRLWRKTAQKEDMCIFRQERIEWMFLGHTIQAKIHHYGTK